MIVDLVAGMPGVEPIFPLTPARLLETRTGPGRGTVDGLHHQLPHGATIANSTTVALSAAGTVCIYTHRAAHLIADVTAYST